jgi:hypothetical protein
VTQFDWVDLDKNQEKWGPSQTKIISVLPQGQEDTHPFATEPPLNLSQTCSETLSQWNRSHSQLTAKSCYMLSTKPTLSHRSIQPRWI